MAKRKTKQAFTSLAGLGAYVERTLLFDKKGVPWVVDPAAGTISPARIVMPTDEPVKQSAVKKSK